MALSLIDDAKMWSVWNDRTCDVIKSDDDVAICLALVIALKAIIFAQNGVSSR